MKDVLKKVNITSLLLGKNNAYSGQIANSNTEIAQIIFSFHFIPHFYSWLLKNNSIPRPPPKKTNTLYQKITGLYKQMNSLVYPFSNLDSSPDDAEGNHVQYCLSFSRGRETST